MFIKISLLFLDPIAIIRNCGTHFFCENQSKVNVKLVSSLRK